MKTKNPNVIESMCHHFSDLLDKGSPFQRPVSIIHFIGAFTLTVVGHSLTDLQTKCPKTYPPEAYSFRNFILHPQVGQFTIITTSSLQPYRWCIGNINILVFANSGEISNILCLQKDMIGFVAIINTIADNFFVVSFIPLNRGIRRIHEF